MAAALLLLVFFDSTQTADRYLDLDQILDDSPTSGLCL